MTNVSKTKNVTDLERGLDHEWCWPGQTSCQRIQPSIRKFSGLITGPAHSFTSYQLLGKGLALCTG